MKRGKSRIRGGKSGWVPALLLLMLLCGRTDREILAQSAGEETMVEESGGQERLSLSEEHISMDQTANENGWVNRDTTFTVTLPEEWAGESLPAVQYRKQEDTEWAVMEQPSSELPVYAFTETDFCYDGAYQFRLKEREDNQNDNQNEEQNDNENGNQNEDLGEGAQQEEPQVTVRFRKDKTAPVIRAVCTAPASEDAEGKHYSAREECRLTLTFTEAFYEELRSETGEITAPELTILKDGSPLSREETEGWITWGEFQDGSISVRVELPAEENTGIRYQVEAAYCDAAGNPLSMEEGSFGQLTDTGKGGFITGIFVVDSKAPELLSFSSQGDWSWSAEWEDGRIPLYRNVEGNDIAFTFAIEEREGWDSSLLSLQVVNLTENRVAAEYTGDSEALQWTHADGIHTAQFGYDGEEGKEGVYELRLSCRDRAGNFMKEEPPADSRFALDHAPPRLCVSVPEAVNILKNGEDWPATQAQDADCVSYYSEDIAVKIAVRDMFFGFSETEEGDAAAPENFRCELIRMEQNTEELTETKIQWSRTEDSVWSGSFRISEEGDYRIRISCRDAAGNAAENPDKNPAEADDRTENPAGEETLLQGTMEEDIYESPLLVVDRTAPVISFSYSAEPVERSQGRVYFDGTAALCLQVEDRNFRVQELKEILLGFEAVDSRGASRKEQTELNTYLEKLPGREISRGVWGAELPLDTEACYSIPIGVSDLAGNQAVWPEEPGAVVHRENPVVDRTPPEAVSLEYSGGTLVNYLPSGWIFSGEKLAVKASGKDETAGIREIRFVIRSEDGQEEVRTQSFQPAAAGSFQVELPLGAEDFRGLVRTEVYDWAGHCMARERNYAVESESLHRTAGTAELVAVTPPSRIVDGTAYYNTDLTVRLTLRDTFSGLQTVWYTGGTTLSGSRDYAAEAGNDLDGKAERKLIYEYVQELTLDAAANNENGVQVSAGYTDNAGYADSVTRSYHIDVTPPEIMVEYDPAEPVQGKYYNQERTAVVTIRERNFDERDVDFQITGTDGAFPEIGGWSSSGSGDDTLHVCKVVFREDGDYTFTLAFQDLAGNRAVYGQTDEFTIDRTAPELSVAWDNEDSRNEIYYADSRRAVIDILEHNFREDQIEVIVTADKEEADSGEAGSLPAISEWRREGDHNTAEINFSQDGSYTLAVRGWDLAGNEMAEYRTELFVIDQTPPKLVFSDVADQSANNGEVRPALRYSDANYDPGGTEILLSGYRNGQMEWKGSWRQLENGMALKLEDFPQVRELDDLYTLQASVRDLAGNQSQAQICFSVNRFGSVYTFDEKTEALAGPEGSYYTNQEQDLVITETNVDTLEFREIICSRNGKVRTMEEGKDYIAEEQEESSGWKQYVYTIGKENFEEEGIYLVTIYSEDRAENASDTGTKGRKLEFAVDKTAPVILVSGAEDGGRYREGTKELTLDIQDNLRLREVSVLLNGQRTVYSASELKENEGRIVLQIQGANYWQELMVTARDAAGNTAGTKSLRLLITPNLMVQFFMNKPVLYTTAGILLSLETAGLLLLRARLRRRDRQGRRKI